MRTKGQMGNLGPLVITLVIVGVLIGAGFFVLGELTTSLDDEPFSVSNKPGYYINGTGYQLGEGTPGAHTFAITLATNQTSGVTINAANYTVSATGILSNTTLSTFKAVNLTYTYLGGEDAYQGVQDSMTAFMTVPDLLPLIVLIIMVVIILSLVFTIPGSRSSA